MARILVIDDEDMVRRVVCRTLQTAGHEVDCACDGDEGLRMLAEGEYDLVVTDLIMPNKEGIETIAEIRKTRPNIPVIAMSGYWGAPYLEAAGKLGAVKLLCKPFERQELLDSVREALNSVTEDAQSENKRNA